MVQNYNDDLIPSFGQDTLPNGDPKNPWLLSLERFGSANLSRDILECLRDFHTQQRSPNEIGLRNKLFRADPALKGWVRSEHATAFTIALLGNKQDDENACSFCQKPENGVIDGCYFLPGMGDGACANCVYSRSRSAKTKCRDRCQLRSSAFSSSGKKSEKSRSKSSPQNKSKKRKRSALEEPKEAEHGRTKRGRPMRNSHSTKKRSIQKETSITIKLVELENLWKVVTDMKVLSKQLAKNFKMFAKHLESGQKALRPFFDQAEDASNVEKGGKDSQISDDGNEKEK